MCGASPRISTPQEARWYGWWTTVDNFEKFSRLGQCSLALLAAALSYHHSHRTLKEYSLWFYHMRTLAEGAMAIQTLTELYRNKLGEEESKWSQWGDYASVIVSIGLIPSTFIVWEVLSFGIVIDEEIELVTDFFHIVQSGLKCVGCLSPKFTSFPWFLKHGLDTAFLGMEGILEDDSPFLLFNTLGLLSVCSSLYLNTRAPSDEPEPDHRTS